MLWPWNPGQRSLKVIGTNTDRSALTLGYIPTMSLYRTVSEVDGNFIRKSQIFPTPVYLTPPLNGFSLELGMDARGQNTWMMGLPEGWTSFKTGLAVQTRTGVWQADIETDTHATTAKTALTHSVVRVIKTRIGKQFSVMHILYAKTQQQPIYEGCPTYGPQARIRPARRFHSAREA